MGLRIPAGEVRKHLPEAGSLPQGQLPATGMEAGSLASWGHRGASTTPKDKGLELQSSGGHAPQHTIGVLLSSCLTPFY